MNTYYMENETFNRNHTKHDRKLEHVPQDLPSSCKNRLNNFQ